MVVTSGLVVHGLAIVICVAELFVIVRTCVLPRPSTSAMGKPARLAGKEAAESVSVVRVQLVTVPRLLPAAAEMTSRDPAARANMRRAVLPQSGRSIGNGSGAEAPSAQGYSSSHQDFVRML